MKTSHEKTRRYALPDRGRANTKISQFEKAWLMQRRTEAGGLELIELEGIVGKLGQIGGQHPEHSARCQFHVFQVI